MEGAALDEHEGHVESDEGDRGQRRAGRAEEPGNARADVDVGQRRPQVIGEIATEIFARRRDERLDARDVARARRYDRIDLRREHRDDQIGEEDDHDEPDRGGKRSRHPPSAEAYSGDVIDERREQVEEHQRDRDRHKKWPALDQDQKHDRGGDECQEPAGDGHSAPACLHGSGRPSPRVYPIGRRRKDRRRVEARFGAGLRLSLRG